MASHHVQMSKSRPEEDEPPVSSLNRRRSASPSKKEASPSSSTSPHPLQFITLTERPSSQKNDYSYTVRSHAMQSFLREKKIAKAGDHLKPDSARIKEQDQQTPKQLSGKFKLATWSRKPRIRKTKTSNSGENSAESVSVKEEDVLSEVTKINPQWLHNQLSLSQDSSTPIESYDSALSSPRPDTNILDVLYHCIIPASLCPLCQLRIEDGKSIISHNLNWEPSNITDPAIYHATLCLVSQTQDLLRGGHESPETLFHKGEAIMLMNRRLLDRSHIISDADIMAVAIFVALESINGTSESASAHRIGLLKMITIQGNRSIREENDIVSRVLIWSDILFSTRFDIPPKFAHLSETTLLSSEIPPSVEDSYSTMFKDTSATSILHSLRSISSATNNFNLSSLDRKALIDEVYTTQHKLLTSPYISTHHQDPQSPSHPPNSQHLKYSPAERNTEHQHQNQQQQQQQQQQQPHHLLTKAFHISALLYIQTQIQPLPPSTPLHAHLLSSLLNIVTELSTTSNPPQQTPNNNNTNNNNTNTNNIDSPLLPAQRTTSASTSKDDETNTNILIWIFATALASSSDLSIKIAFTMLLREVARRLDEEQDSNSDYLRVDTVFGFVERVRSVVWKDGGNEGLEESFGEVVGYREGGRNE